jgi:hypothetical protein
MSTASAGAEIGGDEELFELLEHRLVDRPPQGEKAVEPLADGLAGSLEALLETVCPAREEPHQEPVPADS